MAVVARQNPLSQIADIAGGLLVPVDIKNSGIDQLPAKLEDGEFIFGLFVFFSCSSLVVYFIFVYFSVVVEMGRNRIRMLTARIRVYLAVEDHQPGTHPGKQGAESPGNL